MADGMYPLRPNNGRKRNLLRGLGGNFNQLFVLNKTDRGYSERTMQHLNKAFDFHGADAIDVIYESAKKEFKSDNKKVGQLFDDLFTALEAQERAPEESEAEESEDEEHEAEISKYFFLRQYADLKCLNVVKIDRVIDLKAKLRHQLSEASEVSEVSVLLRQLVSNFCVLLSISNECNTSKTLEIKLNSWFDQSVFPIDPIDDAERYKVLVDFFCACWNSKDQFNWDHGLALPDNVFGLWLSYQVKMSFLRGANGVVEDVEERVMEEHIDNFLSVALFSKSLLSSFPSNEISVPSWLEKLRCVPGIVSTITGLPQCREGSVLSPQSLTLDDQMTPVSYVYQPDHVSDFITFLESAKQNESRQEESKQKAPKPLLVLDVDGTLKIDGLESQGPVDLDLLFKWSAAFEGDPPFSALLIMTNSTSVRDVVTVKLHSIRSVYGGSLPIVTMGPIIIGHELTKLEVLADVPDFCLVDDRSGTFYRHSQCGLVEELTEDDLTTQFERHTKKNRLAPDADDFTKTIGLAPDAIVSLLKNSRLSTIPDKDLLFEFLQSDSFQSFIVTTKISNSSGEKEKINGGHRKCVDLFFDEFMLYRLDEWRVASDRGFPRFVESPRSFMFSLRQALLPGDQQKSFVLCLLKGLLFDMFPDIQSENTQVDLFLQQYYLVDLIDQFGVSNAFPMFRESDDDEFNHFSDIHNKLEKYGFILDDDKRVKLHQFLFHLDQLLSASSVYSDLALDEGDDGDRWIMGFCQSPQFKKLLTLMDSHDEDLFSRDAECCEALDRLVYQYLWHGFAESDRGINNVFLGALFALSYDSRCFDIFKRQLQEEHPGVFNASDFTLSSSGFFVGNDFSFLLQEEGGAVEFCQRLSGLLEKIDRHQTQSEDGCRSVILADC